jgi:predicted phosphodiesterase
VGERGVVVALIVAACGPGNGPTDYPRPPFASLGIHESPIYVAGELMAKRGLAKLLVAHPRLGEPAIRRVGETFDVSWIAPGFAGQPAQVTIDGTVVATSAGLCDLHSICMMTVTTPPLATGLHGLCVDVGGLHACAPSALAIVDDYHAPATVVVIADTHIGDGNRLDVWSNVVDEIDRMDPPADLALFVGDAADTGGEDQRAGFLAHLSRLTIPVFVVTGNHDFDHSGINGHLLEIGPELDMAATYGELRLVGLSSGQDLDDGDHDTTVSESSGPDDSQLQWLASVLDESTPTVVFFHHPIYNGFFATIGPQSRDRLKALVTRSNVLAVVTGHLHFVEVFDADGNSRGLSLDSDSVPASRWPFHYTAARSTNGNGGFAIFHLGAGHVDYAWHALP